MEGIENLLNGIEEFVDNPCHSVCHKDQEQSVFNCTECNAVIFSGTKASPIANSFESVTTEWTGNDFQIFIFIKIKN
jgi:hypothetical protein